MNKIKLLLLLLLVNSSLFSQAQKQKKTEENQENSENKITIFFGFDRYSLQKEAIHILKQQLINLRDKYLASDNLKLEIVGHTCSIGSDKYNQLLSERRAKRVYDFLIKKGFKADDMKYYGKGKDEPAFPNTTFEGRRKNRRVEIFMLNSFLNNDFNKDINHFRKGYNVKDTIIVGKSGTMAIIKAGTFPHQLYKLKFKLLEIFNKSDLEDNMVTTKTTDDSCMSISSMIFFYVIYNNDTIIYTSNNNQVTFKIPAKRIKKYLKIYTAVKDKSGRINWVLSNENIDDEESSTQNYYIYKSALLNGFCIAKVSDLARWRGKELPCPDPFYNENETDLTVVGPRGTIFQFTPTTFAPYAINELNFIIKEYFTPCQIVKKVNSEDGKGSFTYYGIISFEAQNKENGNIVHVNPEGKVKVSIPTTNFENNVSVLIQNSTEGNKWYITESQIFPDSQIDGSRYYSFFEKNIDGIKIGKFASSSNNIFNVKIKGKEKPEKLYVYSLSKTKFITSGKLNEDGTYSVACTEKPENLNIFIKASRDNEKYSYFYDGSLNDLRYKKRKNLFIIKKKNFKQITSDKEDIYQVICR